MVLIRDKNQDDLARHCQDQRVILIQYLCFIQVGHIKEGFSACDTVLEYDPDNIDAIIDKAETYLANEEYDKGMSLLFQESHQ